MDGTDLEMPKLMRDLNVCLGGEDFDLLTEVGRSYRWRRRIDSIRRWACDAIGADRLRLSNGNMTVYQANRFIRPVMRGVLMGVDEGKRREHRDAENAEQNLQRTKRKPNSAIAVHIAEQRPTLLVTHS